MFVVFYIILTGYYYYTCRVVLQHVTIFFAMAYQQPYQGHYQYQQQFPSQQHQEFREQEGTQQSAFQQTSSAPSPYAQHLFGNPMEQQQLHPQQQFNNTPHNMMMPPQQQMIQPGQSTYQAYADYNYQSKT